MPIRFVPAYDTRTGKKLPHHVPEHHLDHPRLGKHLARTPRGKSAGAKAAKAATTDAPAAGDPKEK